MSAVEGWLVRPGADPRDGQDLISLDGVTVGSILWLRELRYPSLCRGRMTDGLNGVRSSGARRSWTAHRLVEGDCSVWAIVHNGVEIAELRWFDGVVDPAPVGVLAGLNMTSGRHHPFACEPMPLTRPHLRVVR